MKEKHIPVQIKAPYYTLNTLSENTERIWIVFHGQGMLAQYFIRKWSDIDSGRNFIIAPQGLSKYYLEGFTGRVGAGWMTKEDRLTEIDNQLSYLKAVLKAEGVWETDKEVILFGFSQGVATACRFAAYSKMRFDQLVIWAGMFPPDIYQEDVNHWIGNERILYFTGDQDPYFKEEMIDEQNELLNRVIGRTPELVRFEGKHEVVPSLFERI
jgi:predicted esterase